MITIDDHISGVVSTSTTILPYKIQDLKAVFDLDLIHEGADSDTYVVVDEGAFAYFLLCLANNPQLILSEWCTSYTRSF